jgi:hypothetical protein
MISYWGAATYNHVALLLRGQQGGTWDTQAKVWPGQNPKLCGMQSGPYFYTPTRILSSSPPLPALMSLTLLPPLDSPVGACSAAQHASDSVESGERELRLWFADGSCPAAA